MGFTPRGRRVASWAIVPMSIAALIFCATIRIGRSVHANQTATPSVRTIQLGAARPGALYALSLGVKDPAQLQGNDAVHVTVKDAQGEVESKWLHAADLDFYLTLRPRSAGPVTVSLSSPSSISIPEISASMSRILQPSTALPGNTHLKRGVIAASPNGTWQAAQSFELGQTVFGSDDERPYAPSKSEDAYTAMVKGFQWFRFTFHGKQPRLVYFVLNVTDRDVPLDVDIFQMGRDSIGQPDVVPFTEGEFVYQVEATQNYPGLYKFRIVLGCFNLVDKLSVGKWNHIGLSDRIPTHLKYVHIKWHITVRDIQYEVDKTGLFSVKGESKPLEAFDHGRISVLAL